MLFTPRLTCCLVLGLALGILVDTPLASIAGMTAAAALVTAAAGVRLGHRVVPALLGGIALVCAGLVHGAQAVANAERPPLARWLDARLPDGLRARLDDPVLVDGWLLRDAAPSATGISLVLSVVRVARLGGAWEDTRGGLAVTVGGTPDAASLTTWRGGRRVRLPVALRRPTAYLDHGVPDGARALARRGTALVGSTKSAALVELVEQGRAVDEVSAAIRAAVRTSLRRHVAAYDPVSADIATAILIGDRTQLDPELERQLQEAGTYHVVAISGGNIAVLAGTVLAVLWIGGVRFGVAALLTAALLVAHAWIIGGGASVVRATAMAVTYLALRVVDQRTSPAHALAVAAAVMLVANPLELVNAGFWLTFGATGALLLLSVAWRGGSRWWQAPLAIVLGSLAVELLLVPVSAYVFQRVTLAGLVLNLGAVPAMASVQMAASLCVLADAVDVTRLASIAGWGVHVAAQALIGSSAFVERVPWATWRVPSPSPFVLLAYYAALAAALLAWWSAAARWTRVVPGLVALLLLLWMGVAPQTLARRHGDGCLHVTAWDVGQGDALLVTFPNGRTMLVDAGGTAGGSPFDVGDRVLGPALRQRGLGRLDYLVVTHGDADHIGGTEAIIRDFRPSEVWIGVPVNHDKAEARLITAAARAGVPWRYVQRGDRLRVGDVELRALHPPLPDWERQRVRNDDSIVLDLRLGDVAVLLTGDISRAVEQELLPALDLPATVVLKAAHHGSQTSSSAPWLDALRPALVLISAGRGNTFGHPAPAVLDRYRERGTAIFRTDIDGQIDVVTDGQRVEVTTFTGRQWP